MSSDKLILDLAMSNLDQSAWNLFEDFKRLDRIVELASKEEYPPIPLLNRINIRLREILTRSEAALEAMEENRKPILLDAAE